MDAISIIECMSRSISALGQIPSSLFLNWTPLWLFFCRILWDLFLLAVFGALVILITVCAHSFMRCLCKVITKVILMLLSLVNSQITLFESIASIREDMQFLEDSQESIENDFDA